MRKQTQIVAFVGGGGKTSCAFLIARMYKSRKKGFFNNNDTYAASGFTFRR